ncbi:MAG: toll/interleukin-1 receptor domain-containing protein, partial [Polyangiaceae bacterium]
MSYARVDKDFALRLAKDLRSAGLKIWIDQLDIQPGANWDDEIESALAVTETTLAILSPAAAASNHVKNEILYALDDGDQVVPVLYQPCQVPLVLKRLHYVDFTSAYDTALAELVGRLLARKGDKARPAPVDTEAGPATVGRAALRRGTLTLSRGLLAMGVLLVSLLAGAAVWWTTRSPAGWAEDS